MSAPGSSRLSSPPSFSKDDSHTVLSPMPRFVLSGDTPLRRSSLSQAFICTCCIRPVTHNSRNLYFSYKIILALFSVFVNLNILNPGDLEYTRFWRSHPHTVSVFPEIPYLSSPGLSLPPLLPAAFPHLPE